jgi:hypothetical protein
LGNSLLRKTRSYPKGGKIIDDKPAYLAGIFKKKGYL